MQDISLIPAWEPSSILSQLEKTPLDQKLLKAKLEKLYQISAYNELQYVGEVLQAYAWIKLAHEREDFNRYFVNQKAEKWFLEEFVATAIRYMIICRRFKHLVMMVLTQQMIVEGLKLYSKKFQLLDKFPRMTSIIRTSLEFDKQFYKLNYINDFPLLFPNQTEQSIAKIDEFVSTLKPGDKIDVLKVDLHSKRFCWLPGFVKKIANISIHVQLEWHKNVISLDKKGMNIHPSGSHQGDYQWRSDLKEGDYVDFQDMHSVWVKAKVVDRKDEQDTDGNSIEIQIQWGENICETLSLVDPRIQRCGTFSSQASISRSVSESFLDDFNDTLLDPEMKSVGIIRSEYNKSILLVDFINYTQQELHLLDRILAAVQSRKFGIEVTAELVGCIASLHPLLHRKFASTYLPQMVDALLEYVNKADDTIIRNFSKERFETVNLALTEFLKRARPAAERKYICEELQLNLTIRFLQSDFLDRKLYAIAMLTTLLKQSKHRVLKRSSEELLGWVREKGILPLIYNEKSHSELISRSADFLQYFLLSQTSVEELAPLLEWNESILKLVNDCYEYLPEEFRQELVKKIKQRTNVANKDALDIIKRTPHCESWLLANGGESWVSVVKEKTKKKDLIVEVFTHPFAVVEKITKEVSELYECRFKTEYFLQLHEANYLPKVLQDDTLPFIKRVQFAAIAIETSAQIKDELFQALAPHTRRMDELPSEAQSFFVALLPKLYSKHVNQLFKENFTETTNLEQLGQGQFSFFRAVFFRLNEEQKFIDRKVVNIYATHHATKKERKEILTIRANPNQLLGMKELMTIVFGNSDLKVTQNALEFIGFLFDHLSPELSSSVVEFRSTLLQSCLEKLYKSTSNQQKYLRIISGLLDQSQKTGIDAEPAVSALFLSQGLTLRVIDHFNVNKSRMLMEVPANLTLHELRAQLARQLNAYPHELKLILGDKELDPRLSGRVIHTLDLTNGDLIAEKKSTVQKVGLCETDGSLNEKCKGVLRSMFKEYSQGGLMSKPQCQKYHQRCVGEVSSMSENKVDKIYEQYDTDKDGYLTEADFLSFYEYSAKIRQSTVWSNLEMFGIRNDLEDLRELEIVYPQPESLARHLLFNNEQFMILLIRFLQAPEPLASAAWQVASRLPLLSREQFFSLELDTSKPLLFRYWLYEVAAGEKWQLMTSEILQRLLVADIETTCIGLKAAIHSPQFQVQTFTRILLNLKKINAQPQLSFHSQVVLDNTLKILQWFLKENEHIRAHFAEKHADYDSLLTTGLMSKNATVRRMYCQAVETIISESAADNIEIFEPIFRLVYSNFEKCEKSTLSIEYFDLYSQLLEVLKQHTTLLPKLDLNWLILTRSMISLFLAHRSTELGLNSPPDQVAQGFLRILRKLLDSSTVAELVPLVRFLFQQSLFPESGKNKLKNAKSRREAYELLYAICSIRNEQGESPGLQQLFAAGFKAVYKKMSSNKSSTSSYGFSSYFYSYNEARSELGYAGIRNLGCICYMIAMLQQLFMTQPFRSLVLMTDDGQPECLAKRAGKEFDDNIFHQLQNLFANLELTEKQDYNPDELCYSFKDFEGQSVNVSVQQDAQEFLNLFFDKIETSLKPTPFKRILEDVFGGKTCNQTVCSNCKAVNERFEPFYPLSLEIKGYKNIEESFKKFINGEVISDYQCDACKKKTDVTKSTLLAKVPNYFIIHLQRMCFNYDKFENEKVNSRWEFPMNLNVYPYSLDAQKGIGAASDYEYTLKGVVLHYGSAEFGHYFSYIKESDTRWIEFNDERVREFDPHDIQVDCFGGQHWRRESQSAYLLVYEKVNKAPLHLEFDNEEEKQSLLNKYYLNDSVIVHEEEKKEGDETEESTSLEKLQKDKEEPASEQQGKKQPEKQKVVVELTSSSIPTFVPEHTREKISKANEQFSFTLNLSNDQFAHFLHKILSIDPPESLSTEYLELCYECFPLRTLVDEQEGISLSEWATKRFKQIIGGHGWEFLKSFGQNWESDILSIERSTRIGMKNLLQCVISDIIRTSEKEENCKEKQELVRAFLQKFTEMMGGEVAKHWMRFREYFQVWIGLIAESDTVREWCKEVKMVERLLDFVLEEFSPFAKEGLKKHTLRNMHYGAEFEHPLQVLTLLLKEGYELSEAEKNCMRHYAFLEKAIKFPAEHFNIIDYLCRNDRPLSEKFAYLILVETGKVSQSDDIKPIIASAHRFLAIKDDFEQLRVEWLIGFPQYIENPRTNSYGVYGINPDQEVILNYISPVRSHPLMQQLVKFKSRAQHVACLLLSMLLQLEADGYIHNLDAYPSLFAFTHPYTYWFQEFVENYYEETHRSLIAKHYTDYGNRIKALWDNRPKRSFPASPLYLIGKTVERHRAKKTEANEMLEVESFDIESSLLELNEENAFLNKKTVKNYPGSEDFRVKLNSYGVSGFLSMDRSNQSSDDEEPLDKKSFNPFEKAFKGKLLRKIVIKNLTYDNILLVARLKTANPEPNIVPANFEVSFQVKGGSNYNLTLQKRRVDEPFGEYTLELTTLGHATREGYWPRQIISEVGGNDREEEQEGSEDSQETTGNPVWVI